MIGINLDFKSIDWKRVIPYLIIAILSIIVLRSCGKSEEVMFAKANLEKQLKLSEIKQQLYVNRINSLNDSLAVIESKKQVVKTKIVTVFKEVESKIASVGSLNTKGIAIYYQKRYELPVVITKYGVSLSDSIGKKNIKELIQKDGLEKELGLTKDVLAFSESQSSIKDTIISKKDLIINEKEAVIDAQFELEKSLNKSLKSEKSKKTIWQIITGATVVGAGYLLLK